MKEINIRGKRGKGKKIIVDDDMFEYLNQWKWYMDRGGYIYKNTYIKSSGWGKKDYKRGKMYIHRLVNNTPDDLETDHINRDKLDNRKENLKNTTRSLNVFNMNLGKNNTTGFKGVSFQKKTKKWICAISYNNKRISKLFNTLDEAIIFRKHLEKKYFYV